MAQAMTNLRPDSMTIDEAFALMRTRS
jgi:hypothetical protein